MSKTNVHKLPKRWQCTSPVHLPNENVATVALINIVKVTVVDQRSWNKLMMSVHTYRLWVVYTANLKAVASILWAHYHRNFKVTAPGSMVSHKNVPAHTYTYWVLCT